MRDAVATTRLSIGASVNGAHASVVAPGETRSGTETSNRRHVGCGADTQTGASKAGARTKPPTRSSPGTVPTMPSTVTPSSRVSESAW
ncbi:MAG: hypothetical protein R3A52_31560 [Polyangiales bacterium]